MKGIMMISAGIAVCIFGFLASFLHSYAMLSLAVFSFIFFFVAWISKGSIPVLLGFTVGAVIALWVSLALLGHKDGSVADEESAPAAAEVPAEVWHDEAEAVPEEAASVPSAPLMFNLIEVSGIRFDRPSAPELFALITEIDWQ